MSDLIILARVIQRFSSPSTLDAKDFAKLLESQIKYENHIHGRKKAVLSVAFGSYYTIQVYLTLTPSMGSPGVLDFNVRGFGEGGSAPPTGRVTASRYRWNEKNFLKEYEPPKNKYSGSPATVAKYLADFFNRVIQEQGLK